VIGIHEGRLIFFFGAIQLPPLLNVLVITIVLVYGSSALMANPSYEKVLSNPNQSPAGQLTQGKLTIRLEATMGEWYPEENDGPTLEIAAFREEGEPLSTPGPLIRVTEGTEIYSTVLNRLDQPLTIHGLHTRPGDPKDLLVVPPGESREAKFLAGSPGTYFYWASRTRAETGQRRSNTTNQQLARRGCYLGVPSFFGSIDGVNKGLRLGNIRDA